MKYRIKKQKNKHTGEIRFVIQFRYLFFFWAVLKMDSGWDAIFENLIDAEDRLKYLNERDGWKYIR